MNPPKARKIPHEISFHGHTRQDPWYWLRDRENPEVIAYLEAENAFTEHVLEPAKALREKLFDEICARIKKTDMSVPYQLDEYLYYTRFEEGKEYALYCRKKLKGDDQEEIILDSNVRAAGHDYYSVSGMSLSRSHRFLAVGEDVTGRRICTLRIRDLHMGEWLPDEVNGTSGDYAWADDEKTIYYVRKDETTLRPWQVMHHVCGTDATSDIEDFRDEDESFYVGLQKTKSRKYICIGCHSTDITEYRVLPVSEPGGPFRVFHPREEEHEYSIDHAGDRFYILTNHEAKNFRLMECGETDTSRGSWKEKIPHRPAVLLEGFDLFRDHLVLSERSRGLTQLRIIHTDSGRDHYIAFDDQAFSVWSDHNPRYETTVLRFGYNSLTTPPSVFDYDMDSGERNLLKQEEVLGDFDPAHYRSERFFIPGHDGKEIPVSLVYRKGMEKNGRHPLYLTGYGSYGHSYDPYFSSVRLSLLDRGFIYAIAHVRGGEDLGREWYEEGRLLNKKNTFFDFIAVMRALIDRGYTAPDHLVINGGSAGGLLVGAVINLAPSLMKIAVADVPFVDVVTTMLDPSIPLTVGEYTEWGNPEEKDFYDYMLSYSPYDNVTPQHYPHLLVTAGLHDSQVQYWEPAKWVARLRDTKIDQNHLLLYTEMRAGHSGKSGRFERYRLIAMEYAFVMMGLGMED